MKQVKITITDISSLIGKQFIQKGGIYIRTVSKIYLFTDTTIVESTGGSTFNINDIEFAHTVITE